jgi:hypothetical protein
VGFSHPGHSSHSVFRCFFPLLHYIPDITDDPNEYRSNPSSLPSGACQATDSLQHRVMDSQPLSFHHRSSSVSSLESLGSWMESYEPLSNLPTPPSSRGSWSPQLKLDVPWGDLQDEALICKSTQLSYFCFS